METLCGKKVLQWAQPQKITESKSGLIWPQDIQIINDTIKIWWKDEMGLHVQESKDDGNTWTCKRVADLGVWTTFGYAGWVLTRVQPPHLYLFRNTWQNIYFSRSSLEKQSDLSEIELSRANIAERAIREPYSAMFKRDMKGYCGPLHSDLVRVVTRDDKIFLVSPTDYPYMILFACSDDNGESWQPFTIVEDEMYEEDAPRVGFFNTPDNTLHIFYTILKSNSSEAKMVQQVVQNSKVIHAVSADDGKTWKKEEITGVFRGNTWIARDFDIDYANDTTHMVFCTYRDSIFYYTQSKDAGKTWSTPTKLYNSYYSDYMMCFDLKVYDGKLYFTQTRPRPIRYPENLLSDEAVILMSEDDGKTWHRLNFDVGFSEEIRLPLITFKDKKTCYIVFETGPGEFIFSKECEYYKSFPNRKSELWFRKGTFQ